MSAANLMASSNKCQADSRPRAAFACTVYQDPLVVLLGHCLVVDVPAKSTDKFLVAGHMSQTLDSRTLSSSETAAAE